MARIKCPQCGTERVVIEGKRKNCRRCGTRLTADMAQLKPKARKAGKVAKKETQPSDTGVGSADNPPAQE